VGLPAPTFPELDRIKGPVVINFFPTWCPDCRTEMPLMARRFNWLKTADQISPASAGFADELRSRDTG